MGNQSKLKRKDSIEVGGGDAVEDASATRHLNTSKSSGEELGNAGYRELQRRWRGAFTHELFDKVQSGYPNADDHTKLLVAAHMLNVAAVVATSQENKELRKFKEDVMHHVAIIDSAFGELRDLCAGEEPTEPFNMSDYRPSADDGNDPNSFNAGKHTEGHESATGGNGQDPFGVPHAPVDAPGSLSVVAGTVNVPSQGKRVIVASGSRRQPSTSTPKKEGGNKRARFFDVDAIETQEIPESIGYGNEHVYRG